MGHKTLFPVIFYRFSCSCTISGFVYGIGTGPSLAAAKQAAAKQAFEKLNKEGATTVCPIFSLKT